VFSASHGRLEIRRSVGLVGLSLVAALRKGATV